jgi:hypothetical protein
MADAKEPKFASQYQFIGIGWQIGQSIEIGLLISLCFNFFMVQQY